MKCEATTLPGVLVLTPERHVDQRGWFVESWNRTLLAKNGIDTDFCQDNLSHSTEADTIRGLHAQAPPVAQHKLVSCVAGAVVDFVVDFRQGSPSFGRFHWVELSAENGRQVLVPQGFLHGFRTVCPNSVVAYKCSAAYAPDAAITVHYGICSAAFGNGFTPSAISQIDADAPAFADVESPFDYAGPLPWEKYVLC